MNANRKQSTVQTLNFGWRFRAIWQQNKLLVLKIKCTNNQNRRAAQYKDMNPVQHRGVGGQCGGEGWE